MLRSQRAIFSQIVGGVLAIVFLTVCITSSICPVCLSEDLLSAQHRPPQNMNHPPSTHDCDRDECACCGFQFVATPHQTLVEARQIAPAAVPQIAPVPHDFPSEFYRPPRS